MAADDCPPRPPLLPYRRVRPQERRRRPAASPRPPGQRRLDRPLGTCQLPVRPTGLALVQIVDGACHGVGRRRRVPTCLAASISQ